MRAGTVKVQEMRVGRTERSWGKPTGASRLQRVAVGVACGILARVGVGVRQEIWGNGELCFRQAGCAVSGEHWEEGLAGSWICEPLRPYYTPAAGVSSALDSPQTCSTYPPSQSHLTSAQAKSPRITLDFSCTPHVPSINKT